MFTLSLKRGLLLRWFPLVPTAASFSSSSASLTGSGEWFTGEDAATGAPNIAWSWAALTSSSRLAYTNKCSCTKRLTLFQKMIPIIMKMLHCLLLVTSTAENRKLLPRFLTTEMSSSATGYQTGNISTMMLHQLWVRKKKVNLRWYIWQYSKGKFTVTWLLELLHQTASNLHLLYKKELHVSCYIFYGRICCTRGYNY